MQFLGKHRGKVINNVDPLLQGRLLVLVPAVSEIPLMNWALPCVPYAGKEVGWFALPPIAANVWVEFEGGDPNLPIWSGCFWASGETPAKPAVPTVKLLQTERMSISLDDLKQELKLELRAPTGRFSVAATPQGIQLRCGKTTVTLTPQNVELKTDPASATLSAAGVTVKQGSSQLEITPSEVSLRNAASGLSIKPGSVTVDYGGSVTVELSPAGINLNKGALEVM